MSAVLASGSMSGLSGNKSGSEISAQSSYMRRKKETGKGKVAACQAAVSVGRTLSAICLPARPRPMLRAKPCELKSKLTAKGMWRETSKMRERLPPSAATLTEPLRRRAFEPGEAGESACCTEMGNLSGTAFTEFRSPRTSYEYATCTRGPSTVVCGGG